MPSRAYTVSNGPCHYDIELCFYVALGKDYATNQGAMGADGSLNMPRVFALTRPFIRSAQRAFHKMFNPDLVLRRNGDIRRGDYTLYEFGACCSFHISASFAPLPQALSGNTTRQALRDALPDGCGVILVEDMSIAGHPHADIGGKIIVIKPGRVGSHTMAHEIGHILGLQDQYSHGAVPALGVAAVDLPPAVENAHKGHLMGKPRNNKRKINAHEVSDIVHALGMTCDEEVCCPDKKKKKTEDGKGTRTANKQRSEKSLGYARSHQSVGVVDVFGPQTPSPPRAWKSTRAAKSRSVKPASKRAKMGKARKATKAKR